MENADEVKTVPTELDAIIDGIQAITEKAGIEALPRPWLPPLAARNYLPLLDPVSYQEAWATENKGELVPVIGIADIPTMQAQETLSLNLSKEGHMAVYSSPAFGKSTFLQTIMMGLARKHNPERLHAYLLDFGTNGLLPLRSLPHIADTMNSDEDEKIGKFIRRMATEIKRRKKMLSQYAVANLAMYEKASGNEEPSILILVDGYEGFKGMKYEDPLEKILTQISREGAGIGLHLIISAGRTASMRANLQSNIKLQLALKMIDDAEPRNIVGRTSLAIDDLPGRGLIKLEDPALFQAALPTEGEETLDIIDAIQAEAKGMDAYWTGERPEEIPMIPEELSFVDFSKNRHLAISRKTTNLIPLGLDYENVQPFYWDIDSAEHMLIVGGNSSGKANISKVMIESIKLKELNQNKVFIHIIDNSRGKFEQYKEEQFVLNYIRDKENYEAFFVGLKEEIDSRISNKEKINELDKHLIFIYDIESLLGITNSDLQKLIVLILDSALAVGIQFIFAGKENQLSSYTDIAKRIKQIPTAIVFANYGEQNIVKIDGLTTRSTKLALGAAHYVESGASSTIKISLV